MIICLSASIKLQFANEESSSIIHIICVLRVSNLGRLLVRVLCVIVLAQYTRVVSAQTNYNADLARADSVFAHGQRDSAISLTLGLLKACNSSSNCSDSAKVGILGKLGKFYFEQTNYSAAESCFTQSLRLREKISSLDSVDLAADCFNLGKAYLRSGRVQETIPLFDRSLKIREAALGPYHPAVAECLNGLSALMIYQAKYRQALPLAERAESIWRVSAGDWKENIAKAMLNTAIAHAQLGEYDQAELLYKHLISLREKQVGRQSPEIANLLTGLAQVHYARGQYAIAEPLYEQIVSINTAQYGKQHFTVALALMGLAAVYTADSRLQRAEETYDKASEIIQSSLGKEHMYNANCLEALADLHMAAGKLELAADELSSAFVIVEASLGSAHPACASIKSRLADIFLYRADYRSADSLYSEALRSIKISLGSGNMNALSALNGLAVTRSRLGLFRSADTLFAQAVALAELRGGHRHPALATSLEWYARHLRTERKTDSALAISSSALEIRFKNFTELIPVLSERDALRYATQLRASLDNYLSTFLDLKQATPAVCAQTAEYVINLKGIVSDAMLQRNASLRNVADSTLRNLTSRMRDALSSLAQIYAADIKSGSVPDSVRVVVDSLEELIERSRADVARETAASSGATSSIHLTVPQIREVLPKPSLLLEFLRYRNVLTTSDSIIYCYLALCIDNNRDFRIVRLGYAAVIDSLVQEYQKHMTRLVSSGDTPSQNDCEEYNRIATSISRIVLQPLIAHASDSGMLIVAPDGSLNVVSFAGIPLSSGRYLVEDHTIHYLNCARELSHPRRNAGEERFPAASGLLILADPDFSVNRYEIRYKDTDSLAYRFVPAKDCASILDTTVVRLPATRIEAERLSAIWQSITSEPVRMLLGADANESDLRQLAAGKRLIHFATHGFQISDDCVGQKPLLTSIVANNPLLSSGLLLAGANRKEPVGNSVDGIFTAEEASQLDLRGTQWVILSACETGLGKVESGEGVYGLRRAFLSAGAASVLSSLWPVSDNGVVSFMEALYNSNAADLPTSTREACLASLHTLRERHQPDHPVHWAAFVPLGDMHGLTFHRKK